MVILLHTNRLQEGVFCRAILHALLALGDKLPCYKTAKQGFAKYPQENTTLYPMSGILSKQAHPRTVDWMGCLQRFCSTSDNNHVLQDRYFIKIQEPTYFNIYCYKSCSHKIRTNNRIFNIRAWGWLC